MKKKKLLSYISALLILFAIGCKHDLVTAHLSIRNKDRILLKDVVLEFSGRKRIIGDLDHGWISGYGHSKLPPEMKSLIITWTEAEEKKRTEINVPTIPKSTPPPEVIITYVEGAWRITVGYERP